MEGERRGARVLTPRVTPTVEVHVVGGALGVHVADDDVHRCQQAGGVESSEVLPLGRGLLWASSPVAKHVLPRGQRLLLRSYPQVPLLAEHQCDGKEREPRHAPTPGFGGAP